MINLLISKTPTIDIKLTQDLIIVIKVYSEVRWSWGNF